jgi:hypothetical protein
MKRIEVHCIYTYGDSIMKPTKGYLKKWGGGRAEGNIMEEVHLFKVYCTHLWNYHNELPSCYQHMLIKNKNKQKQEWCLPGAWERSNGTLLCSRCKISALEDKNSTRDLWW